MIRKGISMFLDKIIEVGWLLIFGLCPIYFSLICYSDFVISQYFLFCLLTEVILFFWLTKLILSFGNRASNWKLGFRKFRILLPVLIFIIVLGLATLFSQSPYRSFWGSYARKMGYLTWLHFFVFFLILFFNLKNNKQVKRIFKIILFSSLIIIIYGFCQFLNFDFVDWLEPPSQTFRIFSTIGQPNFLGSWLLLIAPIIIYFFINIFHKLKEDKSPRQQLKAGLIMSLLFALVFSLVLTQSRGAWIGLFLSFFFFSIIYNFLQKQKRLALLLLILFILIIVFGVYVNCFPPQTNANDSFLLYRLKTLANLRNSVTGQVRFKDWQTAWSLIQEKFILGYGPETQSLNFPQYYAPEYALLEKINSYSDRAHNDFLDMLLVSGILGLISYLFLIVSVFYFGLKNIFQNRYRLIVLVLLTGLFGYLISLQFSFHVIPTAIYFWGYMAIILRITKIQKNELNSDC